MVVKVGQMTRDELKEMIETTVEQKLLELFGDPDEGLLLKNSVRERLLKQQNAVRAVDCGEPLENITHQLELE